MKTFIFLMLATCALGADVIDPSTCTEYPCLIFEDNFDFLDHDVWLHEITMGGGGNFEFQAYVNNRSVSYTRDGLLFIKPDLVSNWRDEEFLSSGELDLWGMNGDNDVCTSQLFDGCKQTGTPAQIISPVMSARLRTLDNFQFKYGRVEIRAKVPKADWMWPAIWMLPTRWPYGAWPASGEIDILESIGNENYGENNENTHYRVGSTLHWGPYSSLNRWELTHADFPSPLGTGVSFADEFHTFTLDWNDQFLSVSCNDIEMLRVDPGSDFFTFAGYDPSIDNPWVSGGKMTPFDQKFYLILNVAVGGTGGFFPDGVPANPPKPWLNTSPTAKLDFWQARDQWYPTWRKTETTNRTSEDAALQIDYIRVYKQTPDA